MIRHKQRTSQPIPPNSPPSSLPVGGLVEKMSSGRKIDNFVFVFME